jgi:nucleoside-diphosphate-sugar epimerase
VRRALLTGAGGFIGRELPKLLTARGFDVHSIGRAEDKAGNGWTHHRCDLLRDDLDPLLRVLGATHLIHMAWYAEPGKFWTAPDNLDWVAASLKLVRAFQRAGGRRIVAAGSCTEYDWGHSTLDEQETPLNPSTLYGEAKAALYRILSKGAPSLDLSFAWGRIFFLYGPFEAPGRLVSSLIDGIARGERVDFSAGAQQRDFMHVEDVAAAFAALLDSDVQGAVNIASGTTVAVRDLVERGARIADGAHLVSFGTRPMQAGEPPLLAAAIGRLQGELGFTPRFGLDEGLRDTVARRPPPTQQEG